MRRLCLGLVACAAASAFPAAALDLTALQASAQAGSVAAQRDLGLAYRRGQMGPVNADMAANWLRKAADAGDPEAQYQLGMMYLGEYGLAPDRARALAWLERAVRQNHGRAEAAIYVYYRSKAGEPQAEDRATRIWPVVERDMVKAAQAGDADAQAMMCDLAQTRGNDIGPDGEKPVFLSLDECRDWRSKADTVFLSRAAAGDGEAATVAGLDLQVGLAGPVDRNKGEALVARAADQGVVSAMCAQAMIIGAAASEAERARIYWQRAADAHSVAALDRLAGMYYSGDGVAGDMDKSLSLYRQSAEAGSGDAQLKLGALYSDYYDQKTVPVDMGQALKWYGLAARQGNVLAQVHLAILYNEGVKVPVDKATAYAWWQIVTDFVNARNPTAALTLMSLRSDFARIQNIETGLTSDDRTRAEAIARDLRTQLN